MGRVIRVYERNKGNAAIATFGTIVGKASAYGAAYDASMKFAPTFKKEFAEGRTALAQLVVKVRTWAPVLAGRIPGFEESDYGDHPEVADDTLADAERMLDLAEGLDVYAALEADLAPALQAAAKETAEAEAADVTNQALLKARRESLALFDEELQRFRRTLLSVLGRKHKDYQKLRADKVREADEDDDKDVPAPPEGPRVETDVT